MRAVLFDVDFTLAKPGPDLGPEGYRRLGERVGLLLDPTRYSEARAVAVAELRRHPELRHDEEVWIDFTERIVQGMGGAGDGVHSVAVEMTRLWERSENFDLYEDVLPVIAELRRHRMHIGLVSNTSRDLEAFVAHHDLDVDCVVSSRAHGFAKPHPTIFQAALDLLGCEPAGTAMVGDSPEDDVEGARSLGMSAFLIDREHRYPAAPDRLLDLYALPPALGLAEPDGG